MTRRRMIAQRMYGRYDRSWFARRARATNGMLLLISVAVVVLIVSVGSIYLR